MNPPPTQFSFSPPPHPPSFTFLPSNPNPNPNPHFYPTTTTTNNNNNNHPITQTPPPPDLPTALSTLKHLIQQSQTTIHSISALLPPTTTTHLSPCPFNLHHRIPPQSLFHHSLRCPSSPLLDLDLLHLHSLRYPKTLQPSNQLIKKNPFVQTLQNPNSDLCFSIDEYCDFTPNFFYKDCPGVVSSADRDSGNRTFNLPGILSVECANFMGTSGNDEIEGFSRDCFRLLPSELWLVRTEIGRWNHDYPTAYSYTVLRAILCSVTGEDCGFLKWVIENSPRYGVVIDVPMRDHIVLLFRLCLKAIVTEANGVLCRVGRELNLAGMSFECPVFVQVLKWLAFQFSVLYGEVNGKIFAINMLVQWISNASLNLFFPAGETAPKLLALRDVDGKPADPFEKSVENVENSESLNSRVIFVSQVAAAVAALHERSLLEEKIKALRGTRPLASYQRMAEHEYFSKKADEERQKRSNYKPLLEHDGFLWQRPHNQDTNKTKTREELLAEERDYKRRRMSYRGKKLKRTATQVTRDIIEEHMEDITRAGGIGCLVKGAEEARTFTSEPPLLHDIPTDVVGLKNYARDSSEISSEQWPHGSKKQLHSHNITRSTSFEFESPEDRKRSRRDSSQHQEHLTAQRSVQRHRSDRDYFSKSPDRRRSNGRSRDHISNRGHRNDEELSIKKFLRSPDSSRRQSHEQSNHQSERRDRNSEMTDRRQRHAYRDRRSDSVTSHEFKDRYDPSESHNLYEDDVSFSTK